MAEQAHHGRESEVGISEGILFDSTFALNTHVLCIYRPSTHTKHIRPQVDRAHYAPNSPYHDSPQYIGYNATISAPHMHAAAIEDLLPRLLPVTTSRASSPRRVLDIGSGSGYLTHVLAELLLGGEKTEATSAPPAFLIVGVEHIPALRNMAEANMRKSAGGRALLDAGKVRFVVGDGRKGWRETETETEPTEPGASAGDAASGGLWDVIHVGASAVQLHEELVRQLRAPGRMFIPVNDNVDDEDGDQHIWTVDKDKEGRVTKKRLFGVRYVPLTDGPKS